MPDISINVEGIHFNNPFVIGSGPPGTNKNVICKAFKEGWGGVVAKTVSLDANAIKNVAPRYGKLKSRKNGEVIGFQNIELISDRAIETWEKEFREIKDEYPDGVLIASIMEEYEKDRWVELTERCEAAGVDAFELNLSCPHGLPERAMGAAMGQDPEIVKDVSSWVSGATKKPVWAKMTPNITDISVPALKSVEGGATGVTAINTILSIVGINLKSLRPMPTVEGYSVPGGYSCQAVRPIALRMVSQLGKALPENTTINGMGGVESAEDAVQFILLGSHTVQVCTGAMLQGYGMVKELCKGLEEFMEEHGFETLDDFRGMSLEYLTTHHDLVERQVAAKRERAGLNNRDQEWDGDQIQKQSDELTSEDEKSEKVKA